MAKYATEEEKKEAQKGQKREYYYRRTGKLGKKPKPLQMKEILLEIRESLSSMNDLLADIKKRLG
jgi:hypothetical protein